MKLFSLLTSFDKKDWQGFIVYVELYHRSAGHTSKVACWLEANQKDWKNMEVDSEKLRLVVPYRINKQTFSNTLTSLGNIAEEYLGWQVWKKNVRIKESCQLIALAQRGLTKPYLKLQKRTIEPKNNHEISIWDDYYKMWALFNNYYYKIGESNDNYTQEFEELMLHFRNSTSTLAQFLLVEVRNRQKLLSEDWENYDEFLDLLYEYDTQLVHITDQLILMNYEGEVSAYTYCEKLLFSEDLHKYSQHIKYSLVTYCIIFLTGIIKQGAVERAEELLKLYEFSLQQGIFLLNDIMPLKKYINIIGVASKMKKYEWARSFANQWGHKVDKTNSKGIVRFGNATVDFYQKKYKHVVEAMIRIKYTNFQYKLRARWLLLRAQFEIMDVDIKLIQIENFNRFISSNVNRINTPTFQGLKSAIKILLMICANEKKEDIIEYYRSQKYIFERNWIDEKIKGPDVFTPGFP